MEGQIDQIYTAVLKYENPEIDDAKREQYLAWFENICNPDFGLIDGLV